MSLSTIASQEIKAKGGRKKNLPKLKTILANPYTTKCPTLCGDEMIRLKLLLLNAIAKSGLQPRSFANTKCIRLGLESCLRAIKKRECSCIFISLRLKPQFLVSLIAQNALHKNHTVQIYAQPAVEQLTLDVFGVRAMIMLLPKTTMQIDAELSRWVTMHVESYRANIEFQADDPNVQSSSEWCRDFIKTMSASNAARIADKADQQKAFIDALSQLSGNADEHSKIEGISDIMSMDEATSTVANLKGNADFDKKIGDWNSSIGNAVSLSNACKTNDGNNEVDHLSRSLETTNNLVVCSSAVLDAASEKKGASNSDNFLSVKYRPLSVLKIQPNPNRQAKKKHMKKKIKSVRKQFKAPENIVKK